MRFYKFSEVLSVAIYIKSKRQYFNMSLKILRWKKIKKFVTEHFFKFKIYLLDKKSQQI
jgi:hypothetical protein